jgi:hypothetical protein
MKADRPASEQEQSVHPIQQMITTDPNVQGSTNEAY